MYIDSKTFTRKADVSKEEARRALVENYPGYKISSFETSIKELADGSEEKFYIATIQRHADADGEFPLPPAGDHSEPDGDEGPSPDMPSDNDGDEAPKEEKSEGGSIEDKIDKLISIVEKLVKSDKEVHEGIDGGDSKKVDTGILPDPVPSPFGIENSPKKSPTFSTVSRPATVTMREAISELRSDISAGAIPGVSKTAQIADIHIAKGMYQVRLRGE